MAVLATRTFLSPARPVPAAAPGRDPTRQATWPATTHGRLGNPYTLWVAAHGLADRPATGREQP